MNSHWKIDQPDPDIVNGLSRALSCHTLTAAVLVNRGFHVQEEAASFLKPSLSGLRPPFNLKDMDAAVMRIDQALSCHEKILIYGDYDADGVTATAVLHNFLHDIAADISVYIPHRVSDGYGLSPDYIVEQALPSEIDLIITVDNGSSSHVAVDKARELNIDVIILDHHAIAKPYPAAVAVVNPKRPDCNAELADLAGVGVVFAVLICLRKHLRDSGFWKDRSEPNLKQTCDLVALGTIADMVPLLDDNRILTATGLDMLRRNPSPPGIAALMACAGVAPETIASDDIAFRLAPRLNAAGRMAHAHIALSLLTTDDHDLAHELAEHLETLNTERRKVQADLMDEIQADLKSNTDLLKNHALVLWGDDWHEGVLGIVAAQLLRAYHRPVVLISTQNGKGKGSARSIPGFDLYRGLTACRDLLIGFGGHALAAGVKIEVDQLGEFRQRFESVVSKAAKKSTFTPDVRIDAELSLNDISEPLLNELELLAPFGNANPEPLFFSRNIKVVSGKIVGKTHLNMQLRQADSLSGRTFQAMQFNVDPSLDTPRIIKRMIYRVGWNRWNGTCKARIIIDAIEF